MVREIANQRPMRPFIASEIAPGADRSSDQVIDAHIRATGISVHHPLGTCKMGTESDETAVVDGQLRLQSGTTVQATEDKTAAADTPALSTATAPH